MQREGTRHLLNGIAIVIGIAVSWVGSTELAQSAEDDYKGAVDSPMFMTWSNTLMNLVLALPGVIANPTFSIPSPRYVATIAFFYLTWLTANYSYIRALGLQSASVVTALFSTAPAFVAIGSVMLLPQQLHWLGWLAVVLNVAGAVAVAEPWHGSTNAGGVLLSLASALAAAVYKVSFKAAFGSPPPKRVGIIMGWIGVMSATMGSVILTILLTSGAESVEWSRIPWLPMLASGVLSLVFNFLINFGIAYTYPLFISCGTVVGIPISIAADAIFHNTLPSVSQGVGMTAIISGFVLLVWCDHVGTVDYSPIEEDTPSTPTSSSQCSPPSPSPPGLLNL